MPELFSFRGVSARALRRLPTDWPEFCLAVSDHVALHYGREACASPEALSRHLLCHEQVARRLAIGLFDATDRLIGWLDLMPDYSLPNEWCIVLLLLRPEYRAGGLGSGIYQAFERWAIGCGVESLILGVIEDNPRADAFWQRQGFECVPAGHPVRLGTRTHRLLLRVKCFTEARRHAIGGHVAAISG